MADGPVNVTAALRDMRANLVEVKQIRWQDILKHQGNVKLGKTDAQGNWYGASTSDEKEIARLKKDGYKVMKDDVNEAIELNEKWNEKLAIKALGEYRKVYEMMKKTGVDKRFIASMEKFYDDLAIGGMFTSRGAEEKGILKIDGKTKYKNANW